MPTCTIEYWNLDWVGYSPLAADYQKMVASIGDAVRFMETLSGAEVYNLNRIDFYTSHEALLLPYEEGLTRQVPRQWGWFNLSTHYPWIGMRTAALDGAHVEYLRGVRNPIAIKVGPSVQPDQLLRLIDVLNPEDEPGRLSFIHRMGAAQIAEVAAAAGGGQARWTSCVVGLRCDAWQYRKHRKWLQNSAFRQYPQRGRVVLRSACGRRDAAGRVHLELTGEDVTECTGGARELTERDLELRLSLQRGPAPELRAVAGNRNGDRAQATAGGVATAGRVMSLYA